MYSPIAIFAYNRLDNLESMMNTLKDCNHVEEHVCFIFSDQYNLKKYGDRDNVNSVRKYLKILEQKNLFKETKIIYADTHMGCEQSVIQGINRVLSIYDRVIDIEDDLLLVPNFLDYMDDALELFKDDKRVGSVTGFTYPFQSITNCTDFSFMAKRSCSWGFGTWSDRWNTVDWTVSDYDDFVKNKDIQNSFSEYGYDLPEMLRQQVEAYLDTWDIQWCYSLFKKKMMTVFPRENLVYNVGYNGTHMKNACIIQSDINLKEKKYNFDGCKYNALIDADIRNSVLSEDKYENSTSFVDNKMWRFYRILNSWMTLRDHNIGIDTILKNKEINEIAIYGVGDLALHLIEELNNTEIRIKYLIDRNHTRVKYKDVPVYGIQESYEYVDAIIVTPIMDYKTISKMLSVRSKSRILSLEQIVLD